MSENTPIIAIILMIAITIVLAVVIASFISGVSGIDSPIYSKTITVASKSNYWNDVIIVDQDDLKFRVPGPMAPDFKLGKQYNITYTDDWDASAHHYLIKELKP